MDIDKKRGSEFNLSGNPEEKFLVDMFGQITGRLKETYNYSEGREEENNE